MKRRLALGAIAACLLAGVSARASAAEIHVMISGGLTAAYRALVDGFEREAGHRLITVYGASMGSTPTAIPVRLGRGEQADVIIVARQALDALVEGLRRTLLAAKSIAYSDSASGFYVSTELFQLLGIEQVAKARMIYGTPVAEIVARGEVEIGFQQLSELLPVKGVTVVGTIPDSVQGITIFSAGIAAWRAMRESGVEPIERTR